MSDVVLRTIDLGKMYQIGGERQSYRTLRDTLGVSIIYITHDLATAYTISDRIIIMRRGSVVEAGNARQVLEAPQHPYSILLKSSILSPDAAGDPDRLSVAPPVDI